MSKLQVNGWEARPRRTSGGGRYYRVFRDCQETQYTVCRGAYINTPDYRADGWYIDADGATMDRRGRGHDTLMDALRWLAR